MEYKRSILLKYGELILKGDNRKFFENNLRSRIAKRLKRIGDFTVTYSQSTIYVDSDDDFLIDEAFADLKKIFGIISLTIAYRSEKNIDSITAIVKEKIAPSIINYKSFKADARRSDKKFPLTSPEISRICGETVLEALGGKIKVDVHDPEITVWVEIRDEYAYIHAGKDAGAGGMPYKTSGRGLLLLSGGIDSPVAGFKMAKRGCEIYALHFESYPYTSERAKEKVITLASKLAEYTDYINLAVISVTDIQLALKDKCREEYFTILLRRSMIRLANKVCKMQKCRAIITGESLGQVASQTMDALTATNAVSENIIFRPLIGSDKEEIVRCAREIDTFDTSILPYEDCCTIFTPRHPKLSPAEAELAEEEEKLDLASLENEALSKIEFINVQRR